MKLEMLALWDEKLAAYMTPFFAQSVGAGIRSLADLVNKGGEEAPAQHPEDFKLYHIGTFYANGELDNFAVWRVVAECVNLKTVR